MTGAQTKRLGRPRAVLPDDARAELTQRAAHLAALEEEVRQARADLADAIARATEQSSVRVVAEAVGLGSSTVHELARGAS